MQTRSKFNIPKPKDLLSLSFFCSEKTFASFKEASQNLIWEKAVSNEFHVLMANDAWDLACYDSI